MEILFYVREEHADKQRVKHSCLYVRIGEAIPPGSVSISYIDLYLYSVSKVRSLEARTPYRTGNRKPRDICSVVNLLRDAKKVMYLIEAHLIDQSTDLDISTVSQGHFPFVK